MPGKNIRRSLARFWTLSTWHRLRVRQTLATATQVDWPSAAAFLARGSLWTGITSFTTFSRGTLHVMLAFLFRPMIAWLLPLQKGAI
jgi:hypothetical protein